MKTTHIHLRRQKPVLRIHWAAWVLTGFMAMGAVYGILMSFL